MIRTERELSQNSGFYSDKISRRRFIELGMASTFLTLLAPKFIGLSRGQAAPSPDSIIIVSDGTPEELVSSALEALGGLDRFIKAGDSVLIKPNASFAYGPERATNTSPGIASTVASLCFEAGASEVVFADHLLMRPASTTLDINGLKKAAEDCGAKFISLEKSSDFELIEVEGSNALKKVDVAKLYRKSDVFINLPVLKHHSSTGSTIGMKNLMGLVYDRSAFHRNGLHQCIAELFLTVKPDLTIVDATNALLSNGPRGPGDVVKLGNIVVGVDPVAVDLVSLSLASSMGYNGFTLDGANNRYIKVAAGLGIGDGDPESVAEKTFELNAAEGRGGEIIKPEEDDFEPVARKIPVWAPYASLSAASVALGILATLYSRRRAEVARREKRKHSLPEDE